MNYGELITYVRKATVVYRKGEVVKVSQSSVTVDAFPERPADKQTVDCHFVTVGFTEHAPTLSHREFYEALVTNPEGEFTEITPSRWADGLSYIEIGGWIGDQTLAFQLLALGEVHGLWTVVTPAVLGFTDAALADSMAGGGLVMASGLKEPVL